MFTAAASPAIPSTSPVPPHISAYLPGSFLLSAPSAQPAVNQCGGCNQRNNIMSCIRQLLQHFHVNDLQFCQQLQEKYLGWIKPKKKWEAIAIQRPTDTEKAEKRVFAALKDLHKEYMLDTLQRQAVEVLFHRDWIQKEGKFQLNMHSLTAEQQRIEMKAQLAAAAAQQYHIPTTPTPNMAGMMQPTPALSTSTPALPTPTSQSMLSFDTKESDLDEDGDYSPPGSEAEETDAAESDLDEEEEARLAAMIQKMSIRKMKKILRKK